MVFEHHDECPSQWKAIESISAKLSINHETLRQWVRRAETDAGERPGPTTDERAKMRALERENKELRRANEMADSTGQRNRTCEMSGSRSREGADAGATRALERGAKGAGLPAARTRRAAHRDADLKVAITRVHAENLGLRGRQGLGSAQPRRHPGGPLHGRTPDARTGTLWCPTGPGLQGHDPCRRPPASTTGSRRTPPKSGSPNQWWGGLNRRSRPDGHLLG